MTNKPEYYADPDDIQQALEFAAEAKDREGAPYLLTFWGQGERKAAEFLKALGLPIEAYKPGGSYSVWCISSTSRKMLKEKIKTYIGNLTLMIDDDASGPDCTKRTMAYVTFQLDGVPPDFLIMYDFGYGYPVSSAHYMFEDGNYSCDDNRSQFIRAKLWEEMVAFNKDAKLEEITFPELECGERIVMTDIEVKLEP